MHLKPKALVAALGLAVGLASGVAPVAAQVGAQAGVPGGPYATAFRVQNLDASSAAQCTYQMFNDAGTVAYSSPAFSVPVGESAFVYTPDLGGSLPSGTFAGVVNCNVDVAAVVNFSDPNKGDSYVGTTDASPTLYTPSAYNNFFGYYTSIRVMNASATAQTARIDYYAPGSATPVTGVDVPLAGNGAATIDQAGVAGLQANISYSAKITGTADLAATVTIFGGTGTPIANQLYAFSTFASGSTSTIYAPVIMRNYYGYNTATTIQNIGTGTASVRVTYSNGTTKNVTIPANSSTVVEDYRDTTLQPNVLYSSKIENTGGTAQPLIVTVNESTPSTNRATTYEGMPASAGGSSLVSPVVMKRYYDYNSSITCQNIASSGTANVSITYKGTDLSGAPVSVTGAAQSIAAGGTGLFYQPAESLPNGFLGSATLNASGGNIVCVANQDQNEGAPALQNKDLLGAYDLIVKPVAP